MISKILILLLFFVGSYTCNLCAQENTTNPKVVCELYRNFDPLQKNWQIRDSIVFTYNQNGYKESAAAFTNTSTPAIQTKFTYNTKNQIIHESYYQWNDSTKIWNKNPFKQASFTYNLNDSLQTISYDIMESTGWNKLAKWEIKYDQNKYKTAEIGFAWSDKQWTNIGCQKFTFQHQNNNCISKTNHTWDNEKNQFQSVSKTIYTYNNNKCETTTNCIWDKKTNWQKSTKDSLIYSNKNILIGQIGFVAIDSQKEEWEKVYQISHVLDQKNHITQTTQSYWNSKNNRFQIDENAQEIRYNYSNEGELEAVFNKHFDGTINQFVTDSETFFITKPFDKASQNNKERS
jgi:hypothetical protein